AELWNLRAPILLLALGLVFATVIVGGYTIHWMIPAIPLAAAFGLAAILSPTDVVAVSALSGRVKMPKGILRLLEGEGLMNDASGLVAFKFAIAAAVTGTFSLAQAAVSFVFISLGGLLCGVVISFLIIRFRLFLRRLGMQDVTMHMLIQILTPFVIYLAAEEIGVSGILAVVAGGIIHAVEQDRLESSAMAKLQIVSSSTWNIILFILNGLVFVILGAQIPDVISVIFNDTAVSNMQVISYILVITFTLMLLRFLWVLFFWNGKWFFNKDQNIYKPGLRSTLLLSISGVRGAVTLAGSFSIPYFLEDGTPFPERNLILFLAAGVILCTLAIAAVVLPLLTEKEEEDEKRNEKWLTARRKLIKIALQTIKADMNDTNKTASLAVIGEYNEKMKNLRFQQYTSSNRIKKLERKLRAQAIIAEQEALMEMRERGDIPEETANVLQERFNELEILYGNPFKVGLSKTRLKRLMYWIFFGEHKKPEMSILNEAGLIQATRVKT
ncbi:Na+/H+ antiporter, partial [Bacillus vallismortis]